MAGSLDPLREAFNFLRKSNPEEYKRCMTVLADYTAEVVNAVIDAPQDQLLEARGRAQQAKAFLRAFRECASAERKS